MKKLLPLALLSLSLSRAFGYVFVAQDGSGRLRKVQDAFKAVPAKRAGWARQLTEAEARRYNRKILLHRRNPLAN